MVESHIKIALGLIDSRGRTALILIIIIIFIVILFFFLGLWDGLSIILLIKYWTVGLKIFCRDIRKGSDRAIYRNTGETLASHVEILKLQLLDASFKHPIGLPQLNQLSINSIDSEFIALISRVRVKLSVHVEFSILSVRLSKYPLDLIRYHVLIVLSVVLQDSLNQLKSLTECLVFNV